MQVPLSWQHDHAKHELKSVSLHQDVRDHTGREQGEGSFKLSPNLLKFGSFCSLAEDLKQKLGVFLAKMARVCHLSMYEQSWFPGAHADQQEGIMVPPLKVDDPKSQT